jgi:hypothetical protein
VPAFDGVGDDDGLESDEKGTAEQLFAMFMHRCGLAMQMAPSIQILDRKNFSCRMNNLSPLEQLSRRPEAVGEDDDEEGLGIGSCEGSIRVVSGSGFRYVVPFPYRLHKMLSDVDARGDASIVSFMPDGVHFKVHNPQRFVEEIIPKAFKQKSLKSFQRQLHLYGFSRVQEGSNKGEKQDVCRCLVFLTYDR